jgi:hypothetical protein
MWLRASDSLLALTADTEWCNEEQIKALFDLADSFDVPLFPFVTHASAFLRVRGGAQGIHPNFLPNSTHGRTQDEVLDHLLRIVPDAVAFRSHCFYSESRLLWKMAERGFKADANLLTYMEYRVPFTNVGGFKTFPTFWSDDVALRRGETVLDKRRMSNKNVLVVNVHPLNVDQPIVRDLFKFARLRSVPFESLYT